MLALLLASVLWPPTAWLRRRGVKPALAALLSLLGFLVVLIGSLALLAPSVTSQVGDIATQAIGGLQRIQDYVKGPPLNLNDTQVDTAVQAVTDRLQGSATRVASGVLTGVGAVTSALVTGALALVLAFFFIKDGPKFLPWLNGVVGQRAGRHLDVVLTRSWATLGSFIQGQAAVGLVDAVLIGIGLVVLGVPLALPLAVLTFFGGFVPIIGAFVVGALAVLVALVTKGTTTALIVTAIIFAVQQVEGNVLQPMLQGRSLRLHPGVVLLAVAAGGGLFGIAGAFLSVPVVAVAAVVLRYLGEVADGRPTDQARSATDAEALADTGRPRRGAWCRRARLTGSRRYPAASPDERTPHARGALPPLPGSPAGRWGGARLHRARRRAGLPHRRGRDRRRRRARPLAGPGRAVGRRHRRHAGPPVPGEAGHALVRRGAARQRRRLPDVRLRAPGAAAAAGLPARGRRRSARRRGARCWRPATSSAGSTRRPTTTCSWASRRTGTSSPSTRSCWTSR